MTPWRLLASGPAPGAWNLALDDAIFRAVAAGESPPTLRLYAWSPPALSIGYGQDRDRDVDLAACRARGIAVLRRVTGGRAVLHDAEVTYSVAAPADAAPFGAGLDAAYRQIAGGLLAALRVLGVDRSAFVAAGGAAAPRGRHPGCFAARGRHEITVDGRKLVGSAQRRERGAFLQHGSILLAAHDGALRGLLRAPQPPSGETRMAGLAEFLDPCPGFEAVAAAVASGFAAAWGVAFEPAAPAAPELREAAEFAAARYGSEAWNGAPRPGAARPALSR